jgi:hypothetical protein
MKKFKMSLWISLILLTGIFASSCGKKDKEEDKKEVTITLNETSVSLTTGEEFTLVATVENTTSNVNWTSSNEQVATVNNGVVSALSNGISTITATVEGKTATATITVSTKPFPVLSLSQDNVELIVGGNGITVLPTLSYDGNSVAVEFTWESKDLSVATVLDGLIEGVSAGQTEVTVSATYNDVLVEKTITVIVNIDASVVLSSYEVNLDAVDVDGSQTTNKQITIEAFVNGESVTNKVFTIELSNDIVLYELTNNQLEISALLPGITTLSVSFMEEGVKVTSVIDIVVSKVIYVMEESINYDLSQTNVGPLDLEALGVSETVLYITEESQLISTEADPLKLSTTWLQGVSVGEVREIKIETEFVTYITQIKFVNNYMQVAFTSAENGNGSTYGKYSGDVTTLGFEAGTEVFEFYTGSVASAWESRLQTTEPLSGYDWWLIDFVLTEPLTGQMTLWIGMFHVVVIQPDGQTVLLEKGDNYTGDVASYNNVNVYDQEGNRQVEGLDANVVYTIEINLANRSNDPRDSFGVNASTTIYLANIFASSHSYYVENVGEKDDPIFNQTHDVELNLTEDNTVGASYVYNNTLQAYEYTTGTNTNSWSNRLQTTDVKVKMYDYMIFDLMLTKTITSPINFWMDMLNLTTLNADGTTNTVDQLYIFNEQKELITTGLDANQIYTFVIKLNHDDEEGRYAFGFNEELTVYLRHVKVASSSYIQSNYPIELEKPAQFNFEFKLTGDNNVGATLTYNELEDNFAYYTGVNTSSWANRLQTSKPEIKGYEYLFFNLTLMESLTHPMHLWMDMLSVTTFNADGTKTPENLVQVFNSNKELVTGALVSNEIYTFVIKLGHDDAEGRYAFGFNQEMNLIISNAYAATNAYYEEFISEVIIPMPEMTSIELSLTSDNNVGATFTYVSEINAYEYTTGTQTGPWANRVQSSEAIIKSYDYLVFDLILTEALTGPMLLWMDMLSVTNFNSDGTTDTEGLVWIFDQEKALVSGALTPGVEYTFVIKLGHADEEGRYALGFSQETKVYLRNPYVAIEGHVNSIYNLNPVLG